MQWKEVSIFTLPEGTDLLCEYLSELGITGFMVENPEDFEEFINTTTPHWDYLDDALMAKKTAPARVVFYLAQNAQGRETFLAVKSLLEELKQGAAAALFGPLTIGEATLQQEEWETNWKNYYKPVPAGKNMIIVPSWEEFTPKPGQTVIRLDPGMAFGTGTHATTRLCLAFLEEYVKPDCTVLDLGCGSGILSVGAVLLGAGHATGVDIDQLAVDISGENAALNGASEKTTFIKGDLTQNVSGKYDIICANIVADVILRLAPVIPEYLADGGIFLASGIISPRGGEIIETFEKAGLTVIKQREEEDWAAFACRIGG